MVFGTKNRPEDVKTKGGGGGRPGKKIKCRASHHGGNWELSRTNLKGGGSPES